jgi:hypothetical protein
VDSVLRQELGLSLSPNKTRITNFVEGFNFLGFHLTRRRSSVRQKSIEKLKDKVRHLTVRCHNLDQNAIRKLNRVLLGFAHYFATQWSTVRDQFALLDHWIRMRLRSMKFKHISKGDNRRWSNRHLSNIGLVSLSGQLA